MDVGEFAYDTHHTLRRRYRHRYVFKYTGCVYTAHVCFRFHHALNAWNQIVWTRADKQIHGR
jgi:hypothetical protein